MRGYLVNKKNIDVWFSHRWHQQIVIRVADENDNAPKFIGNGKPIVAVIPNTANFGYPVTTVQTIDEDIGINADIRYMLLNEPSKLFEIDEISGSIRVLGPMSGSDQRVYGFDVKATDRRGAEDGKSTITNVFVSIIQRMSRNECAALFQTKLNQHFRFALHL